MDLICPNCQKRLSLEDKFAGMVVRCPMCNGMFQAPTLPGASAPGAPVSAPPPPPPAPPPAPPPFVPALPPQGALPSQASPPPPPPLPLAMEPIAPAPAPPGEQVFEAQVLDEAHVLPDLPEPIEAATAPPAAYTRSWGFRVRPEILSWVTPGCVTLLFFLSFFSWHYWDHNAQNLWRLAFGQRSMATYTFYVIALVFFAWPLSLVVLAIEQRWLPLLPALRPLVPWRALFVGGAVVLPFVFFLGDYVSCHFRVPGNPTTLAMKLAFRVHLVAVISCALQFWLEQRRTGKLPEPRVEVRW